MCVLAGDGMFTQNENISTVAAFLPPVERRGRIEKCWERSFFAHTKKSKRFFYLSCFYLSWLCSYVGGWAKIPDSFRRRRLLDVFVFRWMYGYSLDFS